MNKATAKARNAAATNDLRSVANAKFAAGQRIDGTDTSRENVNRVKAAGSGPWVGEHADRTANLNSRKRT
jgi:hypothetical protein